MLENALINGPFMVRVVKAGRYRITPLRWPADRDAPAEAWIAEVEIECDGERRRTAITEAAGTPAGSAELTLPAGPARLTTTFTRGDNATFGAYYVNVELIE